MCFRAKGHGGALGCCFGATHNGQQVYTYFPNNLLTEVLGLVKAQQVKNAVIVPVGSKGGFFPKQIPATASREERNQGGIAAYRTFISSLLDLPGNLIDGKVQQPAGQGNSRPLI